MNRYILSIFFALFPAVIHAAQKGDEALTPRAKQKVKLDLEAEQQQRRLAILHMNKPTSLQQQLRTEDEKKGRESYLNFLRWEQQRIAQGALLT